MDIKQLRTFCAIAELGSLSKASDRLRITQPSLSRQMKLLEHELRTELFVRNGRGMLLTESGSHFLEKVGGVVRQLEQARDDILSLRGAPSGNIVLGVVPTASSVLSARLARRTIQELPDLSLRIVESYGGHLVDWLHRGQMDMAIIYGPAEDLHLAAHTLGNDEMMFVGPPSSRLDQRKPVDFQEVVRHPLVMPSHSHGLRALVERAAARRGRQLEILVEADSFRVLIDIVKEGVGFTVLPPSSIRHELKLGLLKAAPIVKPRIVRELTLASSTERPPSRAYEAIERLIRSEIDALARENIWSIGRLHTGTGS